MRRIRLHDAEGKHVAFFDVPPFEAAPPVVRWGKRTFSLAAISEVGGSTEPRVPTYRECRAFVLEDEERVDPPPAPAPSEPFTKA